MGRPIKDKLFGNRNSGTTTSNDNKIGGEGVAGTSVGTAGTYTSALPTITFSAPEIPTGVRATGAVHGKALTAAVTAAGTGYNLNNVLTQTAGGTGTMATWTVTGLTAVGITIQNGGNANDVGDEFTFAAAGFATPIRVRVTASNAGNATAVAIVDGGLWTNGALPGNTIGMTRTQVAAGQDWNGNNLQVNFTAWGVGQVAVSNQGDYTAITGGAQATSVTPAGGTGATLTITYGIKSAAITEKGSGYKDAPEVSVSSGAGAITASLTGSQIDSFYPSAYIPGGEGAMVADILEQINTNKFKVRTDDGVGFCRLVAGNPNEGQMTIMATDSSGSSYYVKNIQEKVCTVYWEGDYEWEFANGKRVSWTFGDAVEGYSVKITNA